MKTKKYFYQASLNILIFCCSLIVTSVYAASAETTSKFTLPFQFVPDTFLTNDTIQFPATNDYAPPKPEDFSNATWTEAFIKTHEKMAKEFAYTEHKKIDWNNLQHKYLPQISEAEKNKDLGQFYVTLRKYITEINDGHTQLSYSPIDYDTIMAATNSMLQNIGGDYGFAITHISDDSEIVSFLDPEGPAAKAGMQPKAKILSWNGKPIHEAIAAQSTVWANDGNPNGIGISSFATETKAARDFEQTRLITNGAVGDKATIVFQNPGSSTSQTVVLTAIFDHCKSYQASILRNNMDILAPKKGQSVWHMTLPSGYGYIRVANEANCGTTICPSYDDFLSAMNDLKNAPGVILDIRNNPGGNDGLSRAIVGFFSDKASRLVNVWPYNSITEKYDTMWSLDVVPQQPKYNGPVVVLTNVLTFCAGEAIAQGMKQLPQAHLMSFFPNTGGSYSESNQINISSTLVIGYSVRRITKADGTIFEGDNDLRGGVPTDPDGIIPLDADTAYDIVTNHKDYEVNYAVKWLQQHNSAPAVNSDSLNNNSSHNNLG